jgi:hypothetical protein
VIFSFWEAVGVFAGAICILVGTVWWTVAAFRRSLWWGIACFFFLIPVGLLFAVRDWRLARWGVGLTVLGCALMLPGLAAVLVHWPEIEELAREMKADLFPGL